jgi:predicted nucleic acid-binding protein
MAKLPPRNPLIAVDTNVPLDLADRKEHVIDALDVIKRRLRPARLLVTPTVFQELVFLAEESDMEEEEEEEEEEERARASRALRELSSWRLDLVNLIPVGHGIVERIAQRLVWANLLPAEECNDALILAEAALLECAVLLTGDEHLRGMDFQKAALELKGFDVEMPVVATPREIVAKFFQPRTPGNQCRLRDGLQARFLPVFNIPFAARSSASISASVPMLMRK